VNPGQVSLHRLQVSVDRGGWDRHGCRVGGSLGSVLPCQPDSGPSA
jgi:hypothetical protein